ncbi:MAG: signal recognition particle-docking protein FtsY [Solidesulfovibrio magneticus str. Maddingley MBC34]|uniref:Signal recognition particle receptor FtsY n=1 Tax=Solidesulfovibrio magneticus str. Maddingley MBC34 TaxID=1206767 RepID=K6FHA9_9BACT|nr:MAG: signal recognition particle-docking protein FtsY [Solidesulfovibrio magneticus str. Maddingley MBC34]
MGFFSKLKKFWTADNAPEATTQPVAETPAEAPAPAAQAPAAPSEAAPAAADTAASPPAAKPAAQAEVSSSADPTPAAAPEPAPQALQPEPTITHEPESAAAPQAARPTPLEDIADVEPTAEDQPAPLADAAPVAQPATAPKVAPLAEAASTPRPEPMPEPAPEPEPTLAPAPEAQPVAVVTEPVAPAPQPAASPTAPAAPSAADEAPWRNALVLALRQAEPKLSVWLDVLLADVDVAGPVLWERLRFLFESLEAPSAEADAFVAKFADWVAVMEYDEVELFRSELQYRLALALDLEDEEDERNRLFLKLSEGLAKTKEQIVKRIDGLLGRHAVIDDAFWEELEEILIMADVGFEPAAKLLDALRDKVRKRGTTDPAVFKEILREELAEIFRTPKTIKAINPPEVVMMIGVNGVGKTTTIAKLAHRDMMRGKKVLIAAGDTFRAAAIEQLHIWAKRVGADFYSKGANADPAAVAFEAMDKALAEGYDVVYLDTAGRLHTKTNLMEELRKIHRVVGKKHPGAPHRSVLVLDATTGQNALSQVKLFGEAAGVDEIILTKLDGTAKGGVVVGIALSFSVPITYVGLGEKMEDLRPFDGQDFAQALLGVE